VHENERIFRDELVRILRDEGGGKRASESASPIGPPPVVIEAPRPLDAAMYEHPILQLGEEHYAKDPARLAAQLMDDHEVMREAVEAWDRQRAEGTGRLAGKQRADELTGAPFLDEFVYGLPDDGKERELIVIGDLHGCYSCLKAA